MTTITHPHGPGVYGFDDGPAPVLEAPVQRMIKGAVISSCKSFRYRLWRIWDDALPPLVFIGLNPSTADAQLDDPTIRRCMGFARDNGFGGILMMNIYAFRATQPADMKKAPDPNGPKNDEHLLAAFRFAKQRKSKIIAAWGAHGGKRGEVVTKLAADTSTELFCLGTTAGGDPRHPLYIKADQPFMPFV